jgi:hypothetical protein
MLRERSNVPRGKVKNQKQARCATLVYFFFIPCCLLSAYSGMGFLFQFAERRWKRVNKKESVTLMVGSVTNAMRGRDLLSQNGRAVPSEI